MSSPLCELSGRSKAVKFSHCSVNPPEGHVNLAKFITVKVCIVIIMPEMTVTGGACAVASLVHRNFPPMKRPHLSFTISSAHQKDRSSPLTTTGALQYFVTIFLVSLFKKRAATHITHKAHSTHMWVMTNRIKWSHF